MFRFDISVIAKYYALEHLVWVSLGIIFFLHALTCGACFYSQISSSNSEMKKMYIQSDKSKVPPSMWQPRSAQALLIAVLPFSSILLFGEFGRQCSEVSTCGGIPAGC